MDVTKKSTAGPARARLQISYVAPEAAKSVTEEPARGRRAAVAAFLNHAIANRIAYRPPDEQEALDPHDGSTAQDIDDEIAERKFKRSLGIKPFKRR